MKEDYKIVLIILFGIVMGLFETITVIYILEIINYQLPSPEFHPLEHFLNIGEDVYFVELLREFGTMIMLIVLGVICAGSLKVKDLLNKGLYYFMLAFGTWDVFYYIFFHVLTGWPESLLTTDVLFSIPTSWVSPVLAPLLISFFMIITSIMMIKRIEKKKYSNLKLLNWILIIIGSLIILYSFLTSYSLSDYNVILPEGYSWTQFITGLIILIIGFFYRKS